MKIIRRPNFIRVYRSAPALALLCAGILTLSACNGHSEGIAPKAEPSGRSSTAPEANEIVSRFRALDDSKNSTVQVRVRIEDQAAAPRSVLMTMHRKREADGGQKLLMDFS